MKINTQKFTYTRTDGKVSNRVAVFFSHPKSELAMGIDVGELEPEVRKNFVNSLEELTNSYNAAVESLMSVYDLNHRYRTFKIEKMTDIKSITGE